MARDTEWASCLEAAEAARLRETRARQHTGTRLVCRTLSATVKTEAQISGVARGTEGAAGTPTRDPLSSDSNPQVLASLHVSGVAARRVSRRAPLRSGWSASLRPRRRGGASRRKSGAASSRRSTRRPPDARTPSPRPSSDPKREEGLKRGWRFRPGAMPAQRVARGRRIRGPRSISSKVADLLLPETPAGRGCF